MTEHLKIIAEDHGKAIDLLVKLAAELSTMAERGAQIATAGSHVSRECAHLAGKIAKHMAALREKMEGAP